MQAGRSNNETPTPYKTEVEQLPAASQFAIFAMRVWNSAARQKIPVEQALGRLFADFSCQPALALFDECMLIGAMSAITPLTIGCCPSNPKVVADETALLSCFRALENAQTETAETIIGNSDEANGESILPPCSRICAVLEPVRINFCSDPKIVCGDWVKRNERLGDLVALAKYSAICATVLTLYALSWVPFF